MRLNDNARRRGFANSTDRISFRLWSHDRQGMGFAGRTGCVPSLTVGAPWFVGDGAADQRSILPVFPPSRSGHPGLFGSLHEPALCLIVIMHELKQWTDGIGQ